MIRLLIILCSPLVGWVTSTHPPSLQDSRQPQQSDNRYSQPDIQIAYTLNNGTLKYVKNGNTFTRSETQNKPNISLMGVERVYYTLIMLDPDAPSSENPFWAPLLHYVVGNIPSSDVDKGQIIFDYESPAPAPFSGPHNYTFYLYRQKSQIDFEEFYTSSLSLESIKRIRFPVEEFVHKNNLAGPVATNFFLGESDVTRGFELDKPRQL